jgi:hypothetical protein
MKNWLTSFCLVVFTYFIFPISAYAYIDMGTGSMVFQILMGGLIGLLFTIKTYWLSLKMKIRSFYLKLTGQGKTAKR